jgi:hypothetical protein
METDNKTLKITVMKTSKFDLFSENVLTINEMLNVRGGDGEETNTTTSTTEGEDEDIIL